MITTKIKNDKKILEKRSTKGNIAINDKLLNKYYLIKNLFENEVVNDYKIIIDYNSKKLLKEHLKVFSKLGEIIEHAKLVNQVPERKGREKYVSWHYYIDGIIIDNEKYLLQFEVVSLDSGENHYRVQRIEKTNDHCGDVNN